MLTPKEITIDSDNGIHIASFGYYDGQKYIKDKPLKQTGSFKDVFEGNAFIVCCGDVMVRVQPTDYPEILRRTI